MIKIENLHVAVDGKPILKGLFLRIEKGQIHAIMGPNGAGKSTLAMVLAGHPSYEVLEGSITFLGHNLLELEPEERAHLGLFLSFQYPPEISGVSNQLFLRASLEAIKKQTFSEEEFEEILQKKMALMQILPEFKTRGINEGFSGGEKKKNEILQMALFEPKLAILDETDSGLDIDAMRVIAKAIASMRSSENSLLLITHYQRLLDLIRPDFVHVLMDGKMIRSGGYELALELEAKGYK